MKRVISAVDILGRMTDQQWVSSDGTAIKVREMADQHIVNAVRKYRKCMAKVLMEIAREAAPKGRKRRAFFVDAATVDMNLTVVVPPYAKLLREVARRHLTV